MAAAIGDERGRRLLVDARGLIDEHNGTSTAILGMLDGLLEVDSDWTIDLLTTPAAARFHNLGARCPEFQMVFDEPRDVYPAAVRLCQPWDLRTLAGLHAHAFKVAVTMLDTIMWDIIYPSNPAIEMAWTFAATHLDGVLFISEFTRQRFNFRFPARSPVPQAVSYLSFNGADYVDPLKKRHAANSADILVFGNDYDHKWMRGALDVLADAFPLNSIVAVGLEKAERPNVRALPSGMLAKGEIERLYAGARILCYPSFYEGFGLPIVHGIAYGLDVVARRSALLEEVAARCQGPGRILPFDDPLSLVEAVGRSLEGGDVETLPLGSGVPAGAQPLSWTNVGERIMAFVDEMAADMSTERYESRDAALRLASSNGEF